MTFISNEFLLLHSFQNYSDHFNEELLSTIKSLNLVLGAVGLELPHWGAKMVLHFHCVKSQPEIHMILKCLANLIQSVRKGKNRY